MRILKLVILLALTTPSLFAQQGPSYDELLKRVERLEALLAAQMEKTAKAEESSPATQAVSSDFSSPSAKGPKEVWVAPEEKGGYYAQVEAVWAKPMFGLNSAYPAQDVNGNISNVPFEFDMEFSPRVELGYLAPTSEIGFRTRYWHYEQGSLAPDHSPEDDAVAILVGGAGIQDVDTITAPIFNLELDVFDLEATRQGRNSLFSTGFRMASFDQSYGVDSDEGPLTSNLSTDGFGPTAAIEFTHQLGSSPFSLFTKMRGSLLYGDQSVVSAGEFNFQSQQDSLILNGEFLSGIEWRPLNFPKLEGFYSRLGVEAQYWGGVGNLMNENFSTDDDLNQGPVTPDSFFEGNMGFIGLNWTTGWEY